MVVGGQVIGQRSHWCGLGLADESRRPRPCSEPWIKVDRVHPTSDEAIKTPPDVFYDDHPARLEPLRETGNDLELDIRRFGLDNRYAFSDGGATI